MFRAWNVFLGVSDCIKKGANIYVRAGALQGVSICFFFIMKFVLEITHIEVERDCRRGASLCLFFETNLFRVMVRAFWP